MKISQILNSIVIGNDGYVDTDKTIEKLLMNINKAYMELREKTPQYPAEEWVNDEKLMPFSQGNHKLPPSTYIINLGTAGLCPGRAIGTCNCCSFCYAKKAETQYKEGTIGRRLLQTLRWRRLTAEQIANQLLEKSKRAKKNKMKYLRINESAQKSKNLIVNSSGTNWICDNQFVAVDEFTDDMEYQCHGDCDTCDYCKTSKGITIYVEVH